MPTVPKHDQATKTLQCAVGNVFSMGVFGLVTYLIVHFFGWVNYGKVSLFWTMACYFIAFTINLVLSISYTSVQEKARKERESREF